MDETDTKINRRRQKYNIYGMKEENITTDLVGLKKP